MQKNLHPRATGRFELGNTLIVISGTFGPIIGTGLALWYCVQNGGVLPFSIVLFAVFYILTAFGLEAGFHRYFAHHAFKCRPMFKAMLGLFGIMAGEGQIGAWAGTHWAHHRLSDQPGDPHTPLHRGWRGIWYAHMGWLFSADAMAYPAPRRLQADKMVQTLDRYYFIIFLAGLVLPGVLGGVFGGQRGAIEGVLWGGFMRVALCHQATWGLNSLNHLLGTRPYETHDNSRNIWLLALPTMGGAWHNNHHAFPALAVNDHKWWQLDPSAWLLRGAARLGWVWDMKKRTPQ